MKILITGIAGFVGSHLADRLLGEGHEIIGIDNFDPTYAVAIKEHNLGSILGSTDFHLYREDIRSQKVLNNIFTRHNIDLVIHLAAKVGVRLSIAEAGEYFDVNVNGSLNLLESMKAFGKNKLIVASSSSVYGNNSKVPFSENDHADSPISPYAVTKRSMELLCHAYSSLYGMDINCLRFFTVYGPRQRPDLAIHKFTRLIDLGEPIPVYGDGSTTRDYTFIDDLIDGIMLSIKHLQGYHVYNLGESRVISISRLIMAIEHSLGKSAQLNYLPFQAGDVQQTFADIDLARTELGYNPKYSFEEGVHHFVDWYRENKSILYHN